MVIWKEQGQPVLRTWTRTRTRTTSTEDNDNTDTNISIEEMNSMSEISIHARYLVAYFSFKGRILKHFESKLHWL